MFRIYTLISVVRTSFSTSGCTSRQDRGQTVARPPPKNAALPPPTEAALSPPTGVAPLLPQEPNLLLPVQEEQEVVLLQHINRHSTPTMNKLLSMVGMTRQLRAKEEEELEVVEEVEELKVAEEEKDPGDTTSNRILTNYSKRTAPRPVSPQQPNYRWGST